MTFSIGVVALLLTFSRSAIIVGAIGMAYVLFRKKSSILFLAILFSLFTFHFSLFTFFEESFVVRQELNAAAVKLWQSAPLVGAGLGNFLVRLPEVLPTRTIYFLQPVHNIYLLLLSEIGLVGVGLIVAWIVIRMNKELRMKNEGKKIKCFSLIHNSLFFILLLGLVDHYPLSVQQGQLLLTILLAMSYN